MAKKHYFEDIIPEEDILKRYPSLKDEKGKKEESKDSDKENGQTIETSESVPVENVKKTKRGRPRKEAKHFNDSDGEDKRTAHIYISPETRHKLRFYASFASLREGRSLTLNEVVSRAIDCLIEAEFPEQKKNLNK